MDNKKTGEFICNLRKQRNMTQKELANILGITDKAVSKWERGMGYPDISMLHPLADALGTSINELLEGEVSDNLSDTDTKNIDNALDYADKIIYNKENRLGKLISAIIAICLCISIITCLIVNIAVSQNLTWSNIVTASCILSGCLFIPPLLWNKRGIYIGLILLSILLMPFLAVIEYEVSILTVYHGWLWKIGFPTSLTWLIFLWLMVITKKLKINIWHYISIITIISIPFSIFTNYVLDKVIYTPTPMPQQISNISSEITLFAIAIIFFVIGLLRKGKA